MSADAGPNDLVDSHLEEADANDEPIEAEVTNMVLGRLSTDLLIADRNHSHSPTPTRHTMMPALSQIRHPSQRRA